MIKLYLVKIQEFKEFYLELLPLLSKQRRQKTQLFKQEPDRLRSLVAGLLLRKVLKIKQDEQLIYNQFGKPALQNGLEFNISHGGNLVLLAVGESPLGVDTELFREAGQAVVERVFQPQEIAWLKQFPQERFSWLWTRKESLVKADGRGLNLPLSSFSVLPLEQELFTLQNQIYGLTSFKYGEQIISLAVQNQKADYQLVNLGLADFLD